MCGEVVYPGTAGSPKAIQNIPSTDCGGKRGEEMPTEGTLNGKKCTRKKCKKYGEILPFDGFSKNRANSDGYEYHCKKCRAECAALRRDKLVKEGSAGKGRRRRQPKGSGPVRLPSPNPSPTSAHSRIDAIQSVFDEQLAIDLKAIKKRVAAEIIHIIQEAFA